MSLSADGDREFRAAGIPVISSYTDFHAATYADERLHLGGPGEEREIAEWLVDIFMPRPAEQADTGTRRVESLMRELLPRA